MVDFRESLFGCFKEMKSCCIVTFVPCGSACVQGMAVAAADPANPTCPQAFCLQLYCCCIGATINRG